MIIITAPANIERWVYDFFFIVSPSHLNLYCQDITTEHAEKLLYFLRLTEFLLPHLCALSIIILLLYSYLYKSAHFTLRLLHSSVILM
jgi:hypothetical protein